MRGVRSCAGGQRNENAERRNPGLVVENGLGCVDVAYGSRTTMLWHWIDGEENKRWEGGDNGRERERMRGEANRRASAL